MNKGPICLLSGLIFSLLVVTSGYGQKAFIKVHDKKNHEPVAFAHVCLEGLKSGTPKYSLTDISGAVPNDVKERSKIAISYVGYKTLIDTISPGQSLEIELAPTVTNMDEIVVTAQYTPERADKSIYRVDVINARQIEMKAATNMAELLQDQSNMRVSQNGVLGTSLRIQGLSGENVKFLQDGVPLIGRMNGNFDLNQLSLYNVDHVEVIEGPMSVIYGSNALAGVVNIITKENKNSLFSVSANAYVESIGQYNFDGSISSSIKKHGFSLSGGRNFFGGWNPPGITGRELTYKPRRQYFADGYYMYSGDVLKIKLVGSYFNDLIQDKGPLFPPPYYISAFDAYYTTERYSLHTEGSVKLRKNRFVNFIASYSGYERIKQVYLKDLTTLEKIPVEASWGRDTTGMQSWMGRATIAKSDPDQKFNYQLGTDLNYETGKGKRISGYEQYIGDYAGFLSVKWDPVKSISLQPGVRFIYNTKYKAPVVYALSAKWEIVPGLNTRFSYARGFRAPTIKELYMNFVDVNHNVQGNPDLQAERSNNVNLNLNWTREQTHLAWNVDVSGFYNYITNVILLAPTGSNLEYTYINLSEYLTTGFQVGGGFSLYPALKVQAGITMTGVTGVLDPDKKADPLKWTAEMTLNASYRFDRPDLTFSLFYKYTGKTPQVGEDPVDGSIAWGMVNPYNSMDFTATKGFWSSRIRLSAGVKNIFDITAVPAVGTGGGHGGGGGDNSMNVAWGRTFFVKLSFTFNKYK